MNVWILVAMMVIAILAVALAAWSDRTATVDDESPTLEGTHHDADQ